MGCVSVAASQPTIAPARTNRGCADFRLRAGEGRPTLLPPGGALQRRLEPVAERMDGVHGVPGNVRALDPLEPLPDVLPVTAASFSSVEEPFSGE